MPKHTHNQIPRAICFSGGASSAYMLYTLLDSLTPTDHVIFNDTGLEHPKTYEFVNRCETEWNIKIDRVNSELSFEQWVDKKGSPPSRERRWCTDVLKRIPTHRFMKSLGYAHWVKVLGMRFDEPQRIAENKANARITTYYPLFEAKITKQDVDNFWDTQSFKLELPRFMGNCVFCFQKSKNKLIKILRENPEYADWWHDQEIKTGSQFNNQISIKQLMEIAKNHKELPFDDSEQSINCSCTD